MQTDARQMFKAPTHQVERVTQELVHPLLLLLLLLVLLVLVLVLVLVWLFLLLCVFVFGCMSVFSQCWCNVYVFLLPLSFPV